MAAGADRRGIPNSSGFRAGSIDSPFDSAIPLTQHGMPSTTSRIISCYVMERFVYLRSAEMAMDYLPRDSVSPPDPCCSLYGEEKDGY
jgi:hypothetical protein